jgi:hypothetical protein
MVTADPLHEVMIILLGSGVLCDPVSDFPRSVDTIY